MFVSRTSVRIFCNYGFILCRYARDAGLLRIYTVSGKHIFLCSVNCVFPGGLLKRKQNVLTANSLFFLSVFLAFLRTSVELSSSER